MSKDTRNLIKIILTILIVLYFALPPYNKFAQLGYIFNNIDFYIAKICHGDESTEYLFHRNNAVYLIKMNNKNAALREINKAIATYPSYLSEANYESLFHDRALIRIYYKDYSGALDDLARLKSPNMLDNFRIAMLLKEKSKLKLAVRYCNKILDVDVKAYAGYLCVAEVYGSANKYQASVAMMDLLIDRSPNKARYYADRAKYKKLMGDIIGAEEDEKKAKELSPMINMSDSFTDDIMNPKTLQLPVIRES